MSKKMKLALIEITFLGISLLITLLMISLWFYLFDNQFILTILSLLTLLGLGKQVYKFITDVSNHLKS